MNASTLAIIAATNPRRDHNLPPGKLASDNEPPDECENCGGKGCAECADTGHRDTTLPKRRGPIAGYAGIRKSWPK